MREVIYFKRAVYARALQELAEQAFAAGPPPRPDWWSEELLHAREPAPRRRRDRDDRSAGDGDAVVEDVPTHKAVDS